MIAENQYTGVVYSGLTVNRYSEYCAESALMKSQCNSHVNDIPLQDILDLRLDKRVDKMVEDGLLKEVIQ